jgi:hypothetical protein
MKFLKYIIKNKSTSDTLDEAVSRSSILGAFEDRKEEIESLKKYDRGEKEITPPRLKTLSRGL